MRVNRLAQALDSAALLPPSLVEDLAVEHNTAARRAAFAASLAAATAHGESPVESEELKALMIRPQLL